MNSKNLVIGFFIIGTILTGCNPRTDRNKYASESGNMYKELIIYGTEECSDCTVFTQKLDSAGIKYTYRDIVSNDEYYMEMSRKIGEINYKGKVNLPVLVVDGEVYVYPPFSQIHNILRHKSGN